MASAASASTAVADDSVPHGPSLEIAPAPRTALAGTAVASARRPDGVPRELPVLGNTPEFDRPLLREIGNDHVHAETAPAAAASPTLDAWGRVREARRLEVPDNEAVRAQRRRLRDEALWIGKLLRRADPYIAHIVNTLDARYLPLELALLPVIESGFRPHAVSARGASGLWQLMPATAREIGVPRDDWFDGRGDVVIATRAALDYLSTLNARFHGDWELTLAAYNAGPSRVSEARARARASGLADDFWSLRLPRETREYVPKFLALVALLREASGGALDVPHVPADLDAFVEIDAEQPISLARAAELTGLSARALGNLNAGLVQGMTPPAGPHRLRVPRRAAARLRAALARERAPGVRSGTHTVVAGDTLGALARRYGIAQARLREMNALQGSLIRIGQTLAVYDGEAGGTHIEHVVVTGDTLSGIARRYAVDLDDIHRPDGGALGGELIHPGQTLQIHLPSADTS